MRASHTMLAADASVLISFFAISLVGNSADRVYAHAMTLRELPKAGKILVHVRSNRSSLLRRKAALPASVHPWIASLQSAADGGRMPPDSRCGRT